MIQQNRPYVKQALIRQELKTRRKRKAQLLLRQGELLNELETLRAIVRVVENG